MSDRETVFDALSEGHLNLLARRLGPFSRRSILDVGCGDGAWVQSLHRRGANVKGLDDAGKLSPHAELIHCGSPAASIPFAAHTFALVLLRGTGLFSSRTEGPEITIALANLLSCLKPRGRLVVPCLAADDEIIALWQQRLNPFPVQFRTRQLSGGLKAVLTFAKLFGRDYRVTTIEFSLGRKPISRLEWHRLAREAVMSRMQQPPAAA